jgi:hypothetical protein
MAAVTVLPQELEGHKVEIASLVAWCCRSVDSAPDGTPGYRDLYYDETLSRHTWRYPWSNSAERIEVLLWAFSALGDSHAEQCAHRYADAMLAGGKRGILLDKGHPADGMVAYWNEVDGYMTNYTMRVPPAFLAAANHFAESRFEAVALRSAHALLRFQNDDGILKCGYSASSHPAVTPDSINSRCFYAAYAFATMFKHDGAPIWMEALEKLISAIESQQRGDGSFPDQIPCARETDSGAHNGHFHAYILYGLARAIIILPHCSPLREAARKLARFCMEQIARYGSHVYGSHTSESVGEAHIWRSPVPDLAAGLAWLAVADDYSECAEAAKSLLTKALQEQARNSENPEAFGAIPLYPNLSTGRGHPEYGGFYAFWSLLAVMGLQQYGTNSLAVIPKK